MITNREKIKRYLAITKNGAWVKEGLIRSINTEWGFIGLRGDCDVRDMVADGELEASFDGKFRIVRAKSILPAIVRKINAMTPFKVENKLPLFDEKN